QTGPCRNYTAYGPALVPVAGISYATGYGDGKAQEVGIAYGDPNAGVHMAYILLASLLARDRFGGGQVIDLSLWEAMTAAGFEGWINHALGNPAYQADGNHDPVSAPYNVYRVAGDDHWLSICVENEAQWQGLCRAMGNPALAHEGRFRNAANRKANEETLDAIVGAWCAGKERWELTRLLQSHGVPAYPSLQNQELVADPQLLSRDFFSRLNHAEVGVRLHQGPPWRYTNRPNGARSPAPLIGADTDRVLGELLGLAGGDLARLHQVGVLE
ncbi:MAG: CoA transferase, partial [Candidatus Lambdaproteobacteria bacterium]|nr:CoA transferase [Candidatus Lambdaproteobacteria bacterium]